MTVRRLATGLVLLLFATVSSVVIVGLDDVARGQLTTRLPGGPVPSPTHPGTATPTGAASQPSTAEAPAPRPSVTPRTAEPHTLRPSSPKPGSPRPSSPRPSSSAKARAAEPSTSGQARPGRPAPRRGKVVYLTFDDGPGPYTPQVLRILRQTGSTATFFQLGVNARGQGSIQAAIRAQGSTIGNHSYDHRDLTRLSAAALHRQIADGPGRAASAPRTAPPTAPCARPSNAPAPTRCCGRWTPSTGNGPAPPGWPGSARARPYGTAASS